MIDIESSAVTGCFPVLQLLSPARLCGSAFRKDRGDRSQLGLVGLVRLSPPSFRRAVYRISEILVPSTDLALHKKSLGM